MRLAKLWMLLCCCLATVWTDSACGQSGSRSSSSTGSGTRSSRPLVAEPKSQLASPFFPAIDQELRFPLAIKGFCVVTLRDRQQWSEGIETHQQMFDGQLYWFAGPRERVIFASNPQRYVPALSGDCVVTFAQKGERVPGDPQHGILHDRRLFFFRSPAELESFRASPQDYADADLSADGFCPVSRIDQQQKLPGLEETTVIVGGLRYQFAGIHQQRTFLNNMVRYGAKPPRTMQTAAGSGSRFANAPPVLEAGKTSVTSSQAKQKKSQSSLPAKIKNKAMGGYSPVAIRDRGVWEEGSPEFRVDFDGLTYLMASEEERALFRKNPDVYLPALAGHCVVTEVDENRRVKGTIYHAAQHEGESRLFLFAGPEQKERFNADPQRYLRADVAADGLCIVTLLQDQKEVEGLPEFLTWHNSKRYFFASAEKQSSVQENTELFQEQ